MKFTTAMALLFLLGPLKADSIWPGGQQNYSNSSSLIGDTRALKVGDLVTVQVLEQASAEQGSSMKTGKDSSVSGGLGLGSWSRGSGVPLQSYGAGAQENFAGGGSSSRNGRLVTTLTARVIGILESGNFVIEGRRSLKINDEKQHLYVKGIVRPKDVGRNNVVLSSVISDAQIIFEGKGPLTEKSRAGFFTRFLDWIGIF